MRARVRAKLVMVSKRLGNKWGVSARLRLKFFYAFGVYVAWKIVVVEVDFAFFHVDFCSVVDCCSI